MYKMLYGLLQTIFKNTAKTSHNKHFTQNSVTSQ